MYSDYHRHSYRIRAHSTTRRNATRTLDYGLVRAVRRHDAGHEMLAWNFLV
jgi:hypothetical protein